MSPEDAPVARAECAGGVDEVARPEAQAFRADDARDLRPRDEPDDQRA